MSVCALAQPQKTGVHTRRLHLVEQELRLRAVESRVVDLCAGLGQRDGLVESLAAAAGRQRLARRSLAGSDKMRHLIDIVDIQRTKIQNLH